MSNRHEAPADNFEITDPVEEEHSGIAPGAYVDEVPEEEPPRNPDADDETEPTDTELDNRR